MWVHDIRRVELNGTITTLVTTGYTYYMAEGPSQELYLPLTLGNQILKLDTALTLTTFAGSGTSGSSNGVGTAATFNAPRGIIYFALHEALYVAEIGAIRKIIVSTQNVSTVATSTMYLGGLTSTHLTIHAQRDVHLCRVSLRYSHRGCYRRSNINSFRIKGQQNRKVFHSKNWQRLGVRTFAR